MGMLQTVQGTSCYGYANVSNMYTLHCVTRHEAVSQTTGATKFNAAASTSAVAIAAKEHTCYAAVRHLVHIGMGTSCVNVVIEPFTPTGYTFFVVVISRNLHG